MRLQAPNMQIQHIIALSVIWKQHGTTLAPISVRSENRKVSRFLVNAAVHNLHSGFANKNLTTRTRI